MFYISHYECRSKVREDNPSDSKKPTIKDHVDSFYEISDTDNPIVKYWGVENGFFGYSGRVLLQDIASIDGAVSILNHKDLYAVVPLHLPLIETHGKGLGTITVKRRDLFKVELEELIGALDGKNVTIRISSEGRVLRKGKL